MAGDQTPTISRGKYTFRWRGAGRETDHLKSVGKLDHHYDHFHFAYSCGGSIHLTGEERKYHQYRNCATGCELVNRDCDEGNPPCEDYDMEVEHEYRYCKNKCGAMLNGKNTIQVQDVVAIVTIAVVLECAA